MAKTRVWIQTFMVLAIVAGAVLVWALYLPAARPWLDRAGLLAPMERLGLVGAEPVAASAAQPTRGGGAVRVVAEPVTERVLRDRVVAIGTAQSIHAVTVATEVAGLIKELSAPSGSYVTAGDPIVQLDSAAAQIAVERAELTREDEERNYNRLKTLRASGAVPELQVQQAEVAFKAAELALREAQLQLDRHRIVAPISGWVGLLTVESGDLVSTGAQIATIEDRSDLLVSFRVPERLASRVKVGDSIEAAPLADPNWPLAGTVSAIDNRVNEDNRSLRLQATIPNEDDRLRPGMAISLAIDLTGDRYPSVDPLAIQWGAEGAYVWVLREGKARQVPVRLVQRNADDVLVAAEFAPGDLVVTEGVMSLRPGMAAEAVSG